MNKRKIMALTLTLCMAAILVVGGTLAYFTDNDAKDNTFTVGKVDITLNEEFEEDSKLHPGTSKLNFVEKVVTVANEVGSEPAFVRVHIALPSAMVDQDLMSYNDMLHWNFAAADYAAGKWSMQPEYNEENGWADNGRENQNVYNTTIDGVDYTVWVVTYRTALDGGKSTEGAAMTQVYLDWRTETTDGKTYTKANYDANGKKLEGTMSYTLPADGKITVKVAAEGVQAASFTTNAYDALNTAFGVPGTYDVKWAE